MDNRELLNSYLSRSSDLISQAEEHERLAGDLRSRQEELQLAIDLLRPLVNDDPEDLSDVVADFTRCANNAERLIRIARSAPHKHLNASKVAQYLLDHGQSRASFKNYRVEVDRALAQHPELFEKVSAGTYRYRGDAPADGDAGS